MRCDENEMFCSIKALQDTHWGWLRPAIVLDVLEMDNACHCFLVTVLHSWLVLAFLVIFFMHLLSLHPGINFVQNILRSFIIVIETRSVHQNESAFVRFRFGRAYGMVLMLQTVV